MKLRNISLIALILLIGLSFTSCEEDRWESSSLIYDSYKWDRPMLFYDDGTLKVEHIVLDIRDIPTSGYDRIRGIRVFDSFFLLSSPQFRNTHNMRIVLETSTRRRLDEKMLNLGYNNKTRVGEFIIDMESGAYAAFVDDLMYDLERDGRVTLTIGAKSNNIRQNMDVDFEFNNNLDVKVRD